MPLLLKRSWLTGNTCMERDRPLGVFWVLATGTPADPPFLRCAEFMAAYDLAGSSEYNRQLLAYMQSPCREAAHAAALTWAVSADMALMDFTAAVNLGKQAVEAIGAFQKAQGEAGSSVAAPAT